MFAAQRLLLPFLFALVVTSTASLSAADAPELQSARNAMAEGLFDVAALKAARLLASPKLGKKDQVTIASLQVEALIRGGHGDEALAVMAKQEINDKTYWEGHAHLINEDFDQAAEAFNHYPPSGPLAEYARLGLAHALEGEGRDGTARRQIDKLREQGAAGISRHARMLYNELELGLGPDRANNVIRRLDKERGGKDATVQFLRARAMLETGDPKTSQAILRDLLLTGAETMTPSIHDAATILLAEAMWRQHAEKTATETLLTFINSFGGVGKQDNTDYWSEAFALLGRIADTKQGEDYSLVVPATTWIADSSIPERQGHALWHVARELHRRNRDQEAIGLLEAIVQQHPHHDRTSEALRLAMQLHGAEHSDARVLQLAERWRQEFGGGGGAVVDFLVGIIRFARGEHLEALRSFSKAADAETDLPRRRRALYNGAICALKAGQMAAVTSLMSQLSEVSASDHSKKPSSETPADLELDRALQLASSNDPKAEEQLSAFITAQPRHPRWVEANIALAEFCLLDVPPRVKRANEALDAAASTAQAAQMERIGYVRMWLHEAGGDLAGVVREGQSFLTAWPQSQWVDEVQMKVADAFYRQELFAKARTEFELLSRNHPESPYVDAALFWAGMAAMAQQTDDGYNAAIAGWDELAQRGGPLAFTARRQQAVATLRKGDEAGALSLLASLAEDKSASADDTLSVQCERVSVLTTMGRKSPARYDEAVALMRTVLAEKNLSFAWSARCGVLLATALREQKKTTEALEACHDIVDTGSNVVTAPQNPTEFLWYYRAGFLAIELLEESKQWEAAARMAERLAQSGGDRAQEASKRATEIRLKHYLWDR